MFAAEITSLLYIIILSNNITQIIMPNGSYRKVSNMRRTKSQNLNASRLIW